MNSTLQSCPQGFHPSPSPTQPPRSALTAFPTLLRILGSISSITHKSCCSHSTSRLSTVHNSQLVRKTRVNYLTILVARATALFFCLFASSVPGKTPRQCSGWWSSQYNDQTSRLILDVLELLLNLLQPNIREFVTTSAFHLFTTDWRELFENGSQRSLWESLRQKHGKVREQR